MQVPTYLALKFLTGKRRGPSSLTWLAIAGVMVSVLAFVVVQAVMTGFSEDMRKKILGFSPHVTVTLKDEAGSKPFLDEIKKNPQVREAREIIEGEAILSLEDRVNQGVRIKGVDRESGLGLEGLHVFFEEGESWTSLPRRSENLPGVVLGEELMQELGIATAWKNELRLLYPFGDVSPSGDLQPNQESFLVVGSFKSGYYEYDRKYVLLDLGLAKALLGPTAKTQIAVDLQDPEQAATFVANLKNTDVAQIETWQEQHRRLFSALRLERVGMGFVLVLTLLLASFNVVSLLMMLVHEHRRDVAVLKALGLNAREVAGLFYRAGFSIGVAGTILGILGGGVLCWGLRRAALPLPSSYYLESLPVLLRWQHLAFIAGLAPLICVLASVLPALAGKNLSVVEGLSDE